MIRLTRRRSLGVRLRKPTLLASAITSPPFTLPWLWQGIFSLWNLAYALEDSGLCQSCTLISIYPPSNLRFAEITASFVCVKLYSLEEFLSLVSNFFFERFYGLCVYVCVFGIISISS